MYEYLFNAHISGTNFLYIVLVLQEIEAYNNLIHPHLLVQEWPRWALNYKEFTS